MSTEKLDFKECAECGFGLVATKDQGGKVEIAEVSPGDGKPTEYILVEHLCSLRQKANQ